MLIFVLHVWCSNENESGIYAYRCPEKNKSSFLCSWKDGIKDSLVGNDVYIRSAYEPESFFGEDSDGYTRSIVGKPITPNVKILKNSGGYIFHINGKPICHKVCGEVGNCDSGMNKDSRWHLMKFDTGYLIRSGDPGNHCSGDCITALAHGEHDDLLMLPCTGRKSQIFEILRYVDLKTKQIFERIPVEFENIKNKIYKTYDNHSCELPLFSYS